MSAIYLAHHGIKGMKWGVRRFQKKDGSLTPAGKIRYAVESTKVVKYNRDGSKTVPAGFVFNRVGGAAMDVNPSGALYVSYGKADAARYIKSLGPTLMGKLMGTAHYNVQHITVKSSLRMPSDTDTAIETAKLLSSNKALLTKFNESIYSAAVTGELGKDVSSRDIEAALRDPGGKAGQKLAYGLSAVLADPNFVSEAKTVYKHFRDKGYDVLPDLNDRLSGTSETAMIVINPDKLEVSSVTMITKDVQRAGKEYLADYIKKNGKLKPSDLIDG